MAVLALSVLFGRLLSLTHLLHTAVAPNVVCVNLCLSL